MFCRKLSDILEIIKVCCRRKRNCQLKASGLEQMAELRKIWFLCFCLKWCGVRSGTDGLCAGELHHHQAGPNGWYGVWVGCDRWCYQCDMCPPVLRYLHFSAHTITSPVLSIVRKDKATGWPDISQYLNFRYQTDSDECQWQLAEICPVAPPWNIIGNIRWWQGPTPW